ncbi:MAG: hypothetical protein H7Z40_11230, partial [Phycisphaerae bacterium]|nr:hypothetical protein [Gemmatimonadaceae bacterium]
ASMIPSIRNVGSSFVPRLAGLQLEWSVLAFMSVITVLSAITFSVASAAQLKLGRKNGGDNRLADVLRSGTRVAESGKSRQALIVASVSLAMMLLVSAGLVATSFRRLIAVDLGFTTEHVLVARIMLPSVHYDAARTIVFVREAERRLRALAGVRAVGATNIVPFNGANTAMDLAAEEHAGESRARYRSASWRTVSPGYFDAMRILLKQGRAFNVEDGLREGSSAERDRSVIVNEVLASALWPNESDVVGKRVALVSGSTVTVVGVVGSTRHLSPDSVAGPAMYFAHSQFPVRSMWFTVRGDGDPVQLTAEIRRTISAIDPLIPVSGLQSLDSLLDRASAEPRLTMIVFTIFASAAFLLMTVGLYGMVSYSVSQRVRVIGVMMAMGAEPLRVMRDVLAMGLRLGVIGVVIGAVLSLGLAGALRSILYDTAATDFRTYVSVAVLIVAVTAIASAIPARRAAGLDPVRALRGGG